MNWYKQTKFSQQQIEYMPFNYEQDILNFDEDNQRDAIDIQNEAIDVFERSNLRLQSNKEITQIADADGEVVGALASTWYDTDEYDFPVKVFEMDVAVHPEHRGTQLIGLNLIKQGIQQYEEEKQMWEEMGLKTMMRSWVVNPRLIDVLERRYGFEIESQGGEEGKNWAYMVRY